MNKSESQNTKLMLIFNKKKSHSLADVLKGIQQAVNSTVDMLQAQQVQQLTKFWKSEDGSPYSQKVKIGNREIEVPLMSLVPQTSMVMEDIEIKLNAKVSDIMAQSFQNTLTGAEVAHADLHVQLEDVKVNDGDTMQLVIRFKVKETPEGVARLMDGYNKNI